MTWFPVRSTSDAGKGGHLGDRRPVEPALRVELQALAIRVCLVLKTAVVGAAQHKASRVRCHDDGRVDNEIGEVDA